MIYIREPICIGNEHVPINVSIISIICEIYRGDKVLVSGEKVHISKVYQGVKQEIDRDVEFRAVKSPRRNASFLYRIIYDFRAILSLRREVHAENILYLSAGEPLLFAVSIAKSLNIIKKNTRIWIVLHSAVESLQDKRSRNPFRRLIDFRSSLESNIGNGINYICLEHHIANKLKVMLPSIQKQIYSIPHPVVTNEINSNYCTNTSIPIQVGFLGLATKKKGFDTFIRIASELSKEPNHKNVEFHAIGTISESTKNIPSGHLKTQPRIEKYERGEFISLVRGMHFICLPYSPESYKLVASGVFLDAIAQGVPILALKQDALVLEFTEFEVGKVFDKVEEIIEFLRNFSSSPDWNAYSQWRENCVRAANSRSIKSLALKYKQIWM